MHRTRLVEALVLAALAFPTAAHADPLLTIAQLPGAEGCLSTEPLDVPGACATPTAGLRYQPAGMTVSPDGTSAYVVSSFGPGEGSITTLERDVVSGALREVDCLSQEATPGCRPAEGLTGARGVAVSPDRSSVYVAASSGLVVFLRNRATGRLTRTGCVDLGAGCGADEGLLFRAASVAVSPDGRHVYAGTGPDALVTFARDPADGSLRRLGCLSDGRAEDGCEHDPGLGTLGAVAPSPDGRHLYVPGSAALPAVLDRDPSSGTPRPLQCPGGESFCSSTPAAPRQLVVSPDGRSVYGIGVGSLESFGSGGGGNLMQFDRDPRTGTLSPAACFGAALPTGACRPSERLRDPVGLAVAGDGRTVLVLSGGADARVGVLTVFSRDPVTGGLAEAGCLEQASAPSQSGCQSAFALGAARALATSPDGRNVYVAGASRRLATFGPAVGLAAAPLRAAADGTTRTPVACPHSVGRCRGELSLRSTSRAARAVLLARVRFDASSGTTRSVRVRLNRRARRLLARRGALRAQAVIRPEGAISAPTVRAVTLRAQTGRK